MMANDQDGDGPGVDEHLHHRQELGAQQHKEAGHGDKHHHQQQSGPEQVFD